MSKNKHKNKNNKKNENTQLNISTIPITSSSTQKTIQRVIKLQNLHDIIYFFSIFINININEFDSELNARSYEAKSEKAIRKANTFFWVLPA